MTEFLLPSGFKDELFEQASIEHNYKNKIINLFQSNGYELVKPPLIEYANSENANNVFIIKEPLAPPPPYVSPRPVVEDCPPPPPAAIAVSVSPSFAERTRTAQSASDAPVIIFFTKSL